MSAETPSPKSPTHEKPSAESLFARLVALPDPLARAGFLDAYCRDDAPLRKELEDLLAAHDASGLLDRAPPELPGTVTLAGERPAPPSAEAPEVERVGPYRLLQRIGEGGMGVVYLAEQVEPVRRKVALKFIRPGLGNARVAARFEAERQALALMDHPHIARVLDAGSASDGRPYFVMELVKGVPITRYCDELNLGLTERLRLFVQVCDAVQHAHGKGVMHRDIKPGNVLVAVQDGKPVPKVIDFGIAKALHRPLIEGAAETEFGAVLGTLEYMAPEQAELSPLDVDTRADVYALGALLYELLTGETPHDRMSIRKAAIGEALRVIREVEPPRPSVRLASSGDLTVRAERRRIEPRKLPTLVGRELDWVAMRCLEKDRTRRYATPESLARDVERYLSDEPVEAHPPTAAYRLHKFVRKHRAAFAAGAFCGLLLLLASIVSIGWAVESAYARRIAEVERSRAEEAERSALREAATAKAINEFLTRDLLGQVSPQGQVEAGFEPDPKLTLLALLDRTAPRIAERFADRPEVEAPIRRAFGLAYHHVDRFEDAELHLRIAYDRTRTEIGADRPETFDLAFDLAQTYNRRRDYPAAIAVIDPLVEPAAAALGADHPTAIKMTAERAWLALSTGDMPTSERLHGVALERCRRVLDPLHPVRIESEMSWAQFLLHNDRPAEAEPLFRDVLARRRIVAGPKHSVTLVNESNLALAVMLLGRLDEAERLFRNTMATAAEVLGEKHYIVQQVRGYLGWCLLMADRPAEAEPILAEAGANLLAIFGPSHPPLNRTRHHRGWALLRSGRTEAALETVELIGNESANRKPSTADGLRAACLLKLDRPAEAEPILRAMLALGDVWAEKRERVPCVPTAGLLGQCLAATHRDAEAEPLLRQALEAKPSRQFAPPSPAAVRVRRELGATLIEVLERQGKADEAAELRQRFAAEKAP